MTELKPIEAFVLESWETQARETVLVAGLPKNGKTTFALSCTTEGKRTALIACDLGKLSIPPWIDRKNVIVFPYQRLTRELVAADAGVANAGHSKPMRDEYLRLTGDLYRIYKSIKDDQAIQLADSTEFAPPHNLILDGMARLNKMLVDGQCALNGINDPSDLDNKAFKFWGKRLRDTLTIVEQFASLPVNVVLTAWVKEQKDSDLKPKNIWYPDIGGAMDLLSAGTVGAAVMSYGKSDGTYYIRTRKDGMYPWVGVRDVYNMPAELDVTVKIGDKESAWDKVFTKYRKRA